MAEIGGFGPKHQLRMPMLDFWRVQQALAPVRFVDGSPIATRLRMVKSVAEIARIHASADIASAGFEALPRQLSPGITERDACLELHLDLLRRGVDRVPYLVAASGPGGYQTINSDLSGRHLGRGDLLISDVCGTVDGYYCDFDRNFAVGAPKDAARRAHNLVYEAAEAGLAAACPDARRRPLGDDGEDARQGGGAGGGGRPDGSWHRSTHDRAALHPSGGRDGARAGHGHYPGAGIGYTAEDGEKKVMVHEENIAITERGAVLLSRRAPAAMPANG